MDGFQSDHQIPLTPGIHINNVNSQGAVDDYLAMATATAEVPLSAPRNMSLLNTTPTQRSIPLICKVCPKNTKFSDVSHLLTHIASKGHLSNMFKLDIAKYTDDDARNKLNDYQAWFDENNIRELLQSRSENRIQKGATGQSRGGAYANSASVSLRGGHGTLVSQNSTRKSTGTRGKRVSVPHCGSHRIATIPWDCLTEGSEQRVRNDSRPATHLDPVKCEPEDVFDHVSDFTPSSHAHMPLSTWHQSPGVQGWPQLPFWNGAYFGSGFQQDFIYSTGYAHNNTYAADEDDAETSSKYEPSDIEDEVDTGLLPSEDTLDTIVLEQDSKLVPEHVDDEERERIHFRKYLKGEISRLEGVGGFDAAPEEQRRKRNQKKDPSVLVHMEASSRAVQTLEQVTDLNFTHVRWRDVYDEPSVAGSEVCCNSEAAVRFVNVPGLILII